MPLKVRTPNTNISTGSIKTDFIKDANVTTAKIADDAVTLAKISTTGATNGKVLTYNSTTDAVEWADTPVNAGDVEVNPDSYDPSLWTEFNVDIWEFAPLRVSKAGGTPFAIARSRTDNNFAFMEASILDRDYDFSGGVSGPDLMANQNTFIGTPGGGGRRTSAQWTRLRDITVAGTDGTDCEYDAYQTHYEIVAYDKASGNTEVSNSVIDASSDRTQIMNSLEVVARQPNSGNEDLSALRLRYVGTEQGSPDAYVSLYYQSIDTALDMIRFREISGAPVTEFKTSVAFEQPITGNTRIGDITISSNTITVDGDEVEFDADFNITGTAYFGSGNGTQVQSDGTITTFGSASKVPFGDTIQLDSKASDPTGVTGAMYFNSSTNTFRGYNGSAWLDLDSQGSSLEEETFAGQINIVEDGATSTDLSKVIIKYSGTSADDAKAEINLYNKNDNSTSTGITLYAPGADTAHVVTSNHFVVGDTVTNGSPLKSLIISNSLPTGGDYSGKETTSIMKAALSSTGGTGATGGMGIMESAIEFNTPTQWKTDGSLTFTDYHVDGMTMMHPTNGRPIYYNSGWKYFSDNSTAT